ncbi:MAG: ABC transporter substrate-binding protein [Myxococcota bacterium]
MNIRFLGLALCITTSCRVEFGPPNAGSQPSAAGDAPKGEVWIYTSMYQSVVDDLTPMLREALPEVQVRWYRAGSEKVAQRAEAEWSSGGTKACLLMTSDPFWYDDLASQGRLKPHFSPNILELDRGFVDAKARWSTARISLMVMSVNETRLSADEAPNRFSDLSDPVWKDRITMGDPLSSGTMFTTLAFWDTRESWSFVESLRSNGLVAAGGNSSVLTRIETGEREVGVVLLENLLSAAENNSPAKAVFPEDGAIAIPGPIALTSDCSNDQAARAVYDIIQSEAGQKAMVAGKMYSAMPGVAPPAGAPSLDSIEVRPWSSAFMTGVQERRDALKEQWASLISGP